ncbi:MAG: FtsX-like permease family protein [Gemmatimonadaceae bacterium]
MLRHKRFTALAVVSLGVAIALNTTMYSVLDTMIDPKIAMREPDRLISFRFYGDYRRLIPIHELNAAVVGTTFHDGMIGSRGSYDDRIVEHGNRLREARVLSVTPTYFAVLGVRASAGRLLSARDLDQEVRPVVLSERLWRQLFPELDEFEPSSIFAGGEARVVVGLLPYEADFPQRYTDVWQLATRDELPELALSIARLKPGVSLAEARVELNTLKLRFAQRTGEFGRSVGFNARDLSRPPFRPWRFHWALIGSVVAVLLIACANLANLQLARGVARTRELATRAAVGATRRQIVGQLLAESAWLALAGLALGAILTAWGMRLVDASVPPTISDYVAHPQVSWRVLAFAVGATLFCLMLVGLAPALKLSRVDISDLLKSGAGTGKTRSARRQYGALVVIEVALALSLLSSASLLMTMAVQVRAYDLGHDYRGLVTTFVGVLPEGPADRRTKRDWSELLIRQALAVPSVTHAGTIARKGPPRRAMSVDDPGGAPIVYRTAASSYAVVSPDYFRTMRIPMVRGRDFSPGEFAEPLAIVSERTARCLWPGADPIGRLIKLDSAHTREPWLRVIGVAGSTRTSVNRDQDALERLAMRCPGRDQVTSAGGVFVLNAADTAQIVVRVTRTGFRWGEFIELVARGPGDANRLSLALRRGLSALTPATTLGYPQSWAQATGIQALSDRQDFMASLFTVFAVLATALAALGVYAIIAHMVAQRAREFGIRIALGASAREIRELVIREGNVLTLLGIAVGLLVTWQSAAFLRAFLLSDWDRYDSRVFAVAALLLFAVAWLASFIPARRAMRISPTEALRNE